MEDRDNIDWLKLENRIRATPIDLLRQGIRKRSWEEIELCYFMLTSEKAIVNTNEFLPVPSMPDFPVGDSAEQPVKRKRGRPRKNSLPTPSNQNIVKMETTVIEPPEVYDPMADCIAPAKDPNKPDKLYMQRRTHDCKPHPNQFQDDGTEAVDEIVPDRKVPQAILQNQRPPIKNVNLRCSKCGTVDRDVDPALIPPRLTKGFRMSYVCNKCCIGGSGGADDNIIADEPLFEE